MSGIQLSAHCKKEKLAIILCSLQEGEIISGQDHTLRSLQEGEIGYFQFLSLFILPLHGYNTYGDMMNVLNTARWNKIKERSEAYIWYGHTHDWGMFCCTPIALVSGAYVVCGWGDPGRDRPHPL